MLNTMARAVLRPVAGNAAFFTALVLLQCASSLSYSILGRHGIVHYILIVFTQAVALTWLLCLVADFIKPKGWRRAFCILFLALFGVWATVEVGLTAATGSGITPETAMLAAQTDLSEAAGFISQYIGSRAIAAIVVSALIVIGLSIGAKMIVERYERQLPRMVYLSAAIILLATVVSGLWGFRRAIPMLYIDSLDSMVRYEGEPDVRPRVSRKIYLNLADPLTKALHAGRTLVLDHRDLAEWTDTQQRYLETYSCRADSSRAFDIIVIIGESHIRAHSSLYGYKLPTEPCLEAERDAGRFTVFTDVVSAANFTTPSLRAMFNLAPEPRKWAEGAYWPLLASRAGRPVYLYDNQTASAATDPGLGSMLYANINRNHTYAAVADTLCRYDGQFVAHIAEHKTPAETKAPHIVVYHLKGQHFPARDRYPASSARFSATDITVNRPWLNEANRRRTAEYDCATAYTDSVISSILAARAHRPAVAIYFSDHGEDAPDLAPPEARNTPHPDDPAWLDRQYRVPFYVWRSDAFRRSYPKLDSVITASANRPAMLSTVGHTVLGLIGADCAPYSSEADILSPDYRLKERVTTEGYIF